MQAPQMHELSLRPHPDLRARLRGEGEDDERVSRSDVCHYRVAVVTVRGWEDPNAPAYIADGERLVIATDETIAEVAHSAMLLSQAYERAARMLGEDLPDDDARDLSTDFRTGETRGEFARGRCYVSQP